MVSVLLAGWSGPVRAAEVGPDTAGSPRIVRQVDHVLVVSRDAATLFAVLTDTFQLPVAWPFSGHGNFSSGGVSLGNVNLEVLQETDPSAKGSTPRWTGFALEPEPLDDSVRELDARGIRHGVPVPFRDGFFRLRWTTVGLPDVSGNRVSVFLCRYEGHTASRRLQLQDQLQSRGGGPLSILGVRELTQGARDGKALRDGWQKLLSPVAAASEGFWNLGTGPGIRVVPADQDGMLGWVVEVRSERQARQFLELKGMADADSSGALRLGGPMFQGLKITLVERADRTQ